MAGDDDMENGVPEVPEVSSARARLMELDSRRLRIESEAAAIVARLEGMQGEPGLTGALVDADGFPRSDVDIIAARRERQRHAVLQTDMSAVMSEIAQELATMHTAARDAGAVSSGRPPAGRAPSGAGLGDGAPRENGEAAAAPGLESATPIAVISGVVPGSPAETGGLQVGDSVLSFGTVSAAVASHSIHDIAAATQASEGRELIAYVLRAGSMHRCIITPSNNWPGDGLLGCHMTRIQR